MTILELATELSITAGEVRKIIQGLQPQRTGISDNDYINSDAETAVRYVNNVKSNGHF